MQVPTQALQTEAIFNLLILGRGKVCQMYLQLQDKVKIFEKKHWLAF
jgi:hypothetical protein